MSQTLTSDAVNSNDQTWEPPMWALIAFTLFAVTVSIIEYGIESYELMKTINRYTGLFFAVHYMFSLIFVALYLYGRNRKNFFRGKPTGAIGTVGLMMVLQILFGLYHQWLYLTDDILAPNIHPSQMLYTIVLPIFWLVALFHPYIRQRFSK